MRLKRRLYEIATARRTRQNFMAPRSGLQPRRSHVLNKMVPLARLLLGLDLDDAGKYA
jgi:hypothetical protein